MWDLPGPGMALMSTALAGGFLTTEPPGKPDGLHFCFETWTSTILDFDVCAEKRQWCPSRSETDLPARGALDWRLGAWIWGVCPPLLHV